MDEEKLINAIEKVLEHKNYTIPSMINGFLDDLVRSFAGAFHNEISLFFENYLERLPKHYFDKNKMNDLQRVQIRCANDNIELEEKINESIQQFNEENLRVSNIRYHYEYNDKTKTNVFIAFIEGEESIG